MISHWKSYYILLKMYENVSLSLYFYHYYIFMSPGHSKIERCVRFWRRCSAQYGIYAFPIRLRSPDTGGRAGRQRYYQFLPACFHVWGGWAVGPSIHSRYCITLASLHIIILLLFLLLQLQLYYSSLKNYVVSKLKVWKYYKNIIVDNIDLL